MNDCVVYEKTTKCLKLEKSLVEEKSMKRFQVTRCDWEKQTVPNPGRQELRIKYSAWHAEDFGLYS